MSFDDIFGTDIFDFDNDNEDADPITIAEKNGGLWDTGKKENIWRVEDPEPNGVWDSGCTGDGCGDCDCDGDCDEDEYEDEDEFDEDGFDI